MRNLRSITIYDDVRAILDRVLERGQAAILKIGTREEAHVWVHRANRFRVALRINDEIRNNLIEGEGTCVYDALMIQKLTGANEGSVRIKFRVPEGVLTFEDGTEADPLIFDDSKFNLEDE